MDKKTLDAIQCLIGLAQFGSISVAAKELQLEHKTLKNKILSLENKVDKKLINSSSLGTSLTKEGWELYQTVSNDFNNLIQKYNAYLGNEAVAGNNNVINILFPPVTTLFFSIHVLPELYKKHPELTVRITTLNINYVLSYGSHIKNIINAFNIIGIQESVLKLINQDEWRLAMSFDEHLQLFAHRSYLFENNIKSFDDIRSANFIVRQSSSEEYGNIKFFNRKLNCEKNINFIHNITAENDLVKCHLINQKMGIGLLSKTVLNCLQNIDVVELFPEYEYLNVNKYALIYKQNDIDQEYIESIISITKNVINKKLNK